MEKSKKGVLHDKYCTIFMQFTSGKIQHEKFIKGTEKLLN